jgi:hypothetical protein
MGTNGLWVIRLGKHYDETRGQGLFYWDFGGRRLSGRVEVSLLSSLLLWLMESAVRVMFRACTRGRESVKEGLNDCDMQ